MEVNKGDRELGFTMLELLVAMIIIGTLAAIAIPMFRQHEKTAVEATLVSDVREAAYQMEEDAITSSDGSYPSAISPSYHQSPNNNVVLIENDYSYLDAFCLVGTNSQYTDLFVYYDSMDRIVTTTHAPTGNCGTGDTYPPGVTDGSQPPAGTTSSSSTQPPAPVGYSDSKRKKYNICHGTGMLNLPLPAIAQEGHDNHPDDIIPPIPNGYPSGKNWTQTGAQIWYNNCAGNVGTY